MHRSRRSGHLGYEENINRAATYSGKVDADIVSFGKSRAAGRKGERTWLKWRRRATQSAKSCRWLDGGGAKGFYTLGVLKQLDALLGKGPLSDRFDLIFGTSTGAIIAALLALGRSVESIRHLYEEHVPRLMALRGSGPRTRALERLASDVFGDLRFDAVKTGIGIVTARWREKRPMIFKASVDVIRDS